LDVKQLTNENFLRLLKQSTGAVDEGETENKKDKKGASKKEVVTGGKKVKADSTDAAGGTKEVHVWSALDDNYLLDKGMALKVLTGIFRTTQAK
jgi:hypothetical protein